MSSRPSPTEQVSPKYHVTQQPTSVVPVQPAEVSALQKNPSKRELPVELADGGNSTMDSTHPARKRVKRGEPPIWARKAGQNTSSGNATKAKPKPKSKPVPLPAIDTSDPSREANGVSLPLAQPALLDVGPLGPWEPSITNVIPHEEITKAVMDFLFLEVVERTDFKIGAAGALSGLGGAQLEIEAKLGQLIDRNTNERLRLPVSTECIFNKDDPNWRTAFRSSMTEVSFITSLHHY